MIKTRIKREKYTACDSCQEEFTFDEDRTPAIPGFDLCNSCSYKITHPEEIDNDVRSLEKNIVQLKKDLKKAVDVRKKLKGFVLIAPKREEIQREEFGDGRYGAIFVKGNPGVNSRVGRG